MANVSFIIMAMSSEGGGQIVAKSTSNIEILEKCKDEHESIFLNKTSSAKFYCLSQNKNGILIQQICRTEGGRAGSYNSFCIHVPQGQIIKSDILPIFDRIYKIYCELEGNKRDNALLEIADSTELSSYDCSMSYSNTKSFAYRIVDARTIEEVLHNPVQFSYSRYGYILLVDSNDKICSSDVPFISDGIEKKGRYHIPSQTVNGIEFVPQVPFVEEYPSRLSDLSIKFCASGYEDVEIKYGEKITESDIYLTIPHSLFQVTPDDSNISCNVGEKTKSAFIVPYGSYRTAVFTIRKDGYKDEIAKLVDLDLKKSNKFTLIAKSETSSIDFHSVNHEVTKVKISYNSKDFPQDFETYDYVIFPKSKIEMYVNIKKRYFFYLLAGIIISLLLGLYVGYCLWHSSDTKDDGAMKRIEQYTNYVHNNKWYKGGNHDNSSLEPNGLWDALNTYNYNDIKQLYKYYKDSVTSLGRLQEVINCIDSLPSQPKRGSKSDFTKGDRPIDIDRWIQNVNDANHIDVRVENYLAAPVWRKGKCSDDYENKNNFRTKEPDGLWDAMNTYNYSEIKEIYENLKGQGYNLGNLKSVYECVKSVRHKPGESSYCENGGGIGIANWIKKVKDANRQSHGTVGSGASTNKTYPCANCKQRFNSQAELDKHIENCNG